MSAALALIAHDLKNALGGLEAELGALAAAPSVEQAQSAHLHCSDLRREFVHFLTLYGAETDGLRALCDDESPVELLQTLQQSWLQRLTRTGSALSIVIEGADHAPPFWYFDRRLLQLALDAAIHNATRFARNKITLSVCVKEQPEGRQLVWLIRDDGPGLIQENTCAHATGLGTSLCEAVAMAHTLGGHQGRVCLHSSPEGGALFEMHLP
jgi:signal transduction histidine kinase